MIASPQMREMFLVLTGSQWPTADEQQLFAIADEWRQLSGTVTTELTSLLVAAVRQIEESFTGQAARRFADSMSLYVSGDSGYLPATAAALDQLADSVLNVGLQVQYVKLVSIMELVLLIAQIGWAVDVFLTL